MSGNLFRDQGISLELIANTMYGPSYISLEWALSYYGLIPERVYEITSITTKIAKKYNTAFGRFTYKKGNKAIYPIGIILQQNSDGTYFMIENLYAGKVHALLFRNCKQRVKGRDWYDFEWYVKNNYKLNLDYLTIRARESGDLSAIEAFTKESLQKVLIEKISNLNVDAAKLDIKRFVKDDKVFDIWSKDYFKLLVEKIQFISME